MSWMLSDARRDPSRPGVYVYLLGTWNAGGGGLVRGVVMLSLCHSTTTSACDNRVRDSSFFVM